MVGAAAGRKLGWLMPFVAIGWLWAHGIVGSAGHAHGWGPRPGGATLQLAKLGNQEIAGVFQEVSIAAVGPPKWAPGQQNVCWALGQAWATHAWPAHSTMGLQLGAHGCTGS